MSFDPESNWYGRQGMPGKSNWNTVQWANWSAGQMQRARETAAAQSAKREAEEASARKLRSQQQSISHIGISVGHAPRLAASNNTTQRQPRSTVSSAGTPPSPTLRLPSPRQHPIHPAPSVRGGLRTLLAKMTAFFERL